MIKRAMLVFGVMCCALVGFASNATAQISIGVGLKGGLNGSAVAGVPEDEAIPFNSGATVDPNIYAMFGLGGTIGATVEMRAFDWVGLETGLHLSFDNGSGYEDINDGATGIKLLRINQKQRTTAYHIPILLKLAIPAPLVQPVFGIGTEIVVQSDSTLEYDTQPTTQTREIENATYPLLMLTVGLELNVSVIRIPIELRAGYNVGFDNTASERAAYSGTNLGTATITYDGAYQGHFALFTGIIYDFDIAL